jgi:hypothetical protein
LERNPSILGLWIFLKRISRFLESFCELFPAEEEQEKKVQMKRPSGKRQGARIFVHVPASQNIN